MSVVHVLPLHQLSISHSAAVQGVMVVPLNDTIVVILWEALVIQGYPNAVENYTVVYSPVSQHHSEMSVVFPSTATSGVITGLDPEVTYQFQVFATAIVDNTTLVGERSSPVQIKGKDEILHVPCKVYYSLVPGQQTRTLYCVMIDADENLSSECKCNSSAAPIIAGVIIAIIGVVVGVTGLITTLIMWKNFKMK